LFSVSDYTSHKLIYSLLEKKILLRSTTKKFSVKTNQSIKDFSYGDIFIPVDYQNYGREELFSILSKEAKEHGIDLYAAATGLTPTGVDLGSRSLLPVEKPKVLMLAERGMSTASSGEIWHLLDYKNEIPVTIFESYYFSKINIFDYTTIILPDGTPKLKKADVERLSLWVKEGGVLISLKKSAKWLKKNKLINLDYKASPKLDKDLDYAYAERGMLKGALGVGGSTFMAKIDNSHPLAYGYIENQIPIFKSSSLGTITTNGHASPLTLTQNPLICGYLHEKTENVLSGSDQLSIAKKGKGVIISFHFNPNFRGYWLGTDKIFLNAIFYGSTIK
jgi:hypothetical protein